MNPANQEHQESKSFISKLIDNTKLIPKGLGLQFGGSDVKFGDSIANSPLITSKTAKWIALSAILLAFVFWTRKK